MIVYVEYSTESIKKTTNLISEFSVIAGYKLKKFNFNSIN